MPIDPVYNPSLPASSMGSSSSSPSDMPSWSTSSTESLTSWSSFAAGACAGACIGAALALMYAPMRGTELRSSLRRYASDGSERLSHLIDNGRSIAEDALQRATSVFEQGRRAFRTSRNWASRSQSSAQPFTASVSEISGIDRGFEEPLGG
jgi:gas vesicle protein